MFKKLALAGALVCFGGASASAAVLPATCAGISASDAAHLNALLKDALSKAVSENATTEGAGHSGLAFNMWATLVANDGSVCAVAYSGSAYTDQWLASRIISAQKAETANSLSLATVSGASHNGNLALASANLYSADRDGGSLFGLQFSNPVDPKDAYHLPNGGVPDATTFGTAGDPVVGQPIGGVNVFGGGLGLYDQAGQKEGGLGVSGDTSCTDHMVAWRTRHHLNLDFLATAGVAGPASLFAGDAKHPDNIIFDIPANTTGLVGSNGLSASGFGHPTCLNTPKFSSSTKTPTQLPAVQ
jgi:hypothetical protein